METPTDPMAMTPGYDPATGMPDPTMTPGYIDPATGLPDPTMTPGYIDPATGMPDPAMTPGYDPYYDPAMVESRRLEMSGMRDFQADIIGTMMDHGGDQSMETMAYMMSIGDEEKFSNDYGLSDGTHNDGSYDDG